MTLLQALQLMYLNAGNGYTTIGSIEIKVERVRL